MTLFELAKAENPNARWIEIIGGCPSDFGLEEEGKCMNDCEKCWNREMPNTNKSVVLTAMENGWESEVAKKIKEQEEDIYNKGLNDAWELARKIDIFDEEERTKIFGYLTSEYIKEHYTVQEALAKLKAYEEAQIEVGDVVKFETGENGIVTYINCDGDLMGFSEDGRLFTEMPISCCKKTGKHIDIKSILEQIGE